jgi:hypothetical protein
MSRRNLKRALVAHQERVSADSRSRSAVLVCGRDRGRSPGAAPHLARAPRRISGVLALAVAQPCWQTEDIGCARGIAHTTAEVLVDGIPGFFSVI